MREHRLFSFTPLQTGIEIMLDANATRHALQALRLQTGDPLTLFDGSGDDYQATILQADKRGARVRVERILRSEPTSALQLHLAMGISRGERMDFSIQKAVELGITSITPLFTERTMVQLVGQRLNKRLAHWQGVIRHACEQSGRSRLPDLLPAQSLTEWLTNFQGFGLMLDHRATLTLPKLSPPPHQSATLLVGPEGGLSSHERTLAGRSGFNAIRMGPRILRTETAPLAALAALQTLWGDFRH